MNTWEKVQKFLGSRPFYNFIAASVVAMLVWGLWLTIGQRQLMGDLRTLTDCVAEYSNAQNANTKLRSDAAAEERKAQDAWFSAVAEALRLPPAQMRSAIDAAFVDYQKARARIEGKREVLPIPDPPSVTCG